MMLQPEQKANELLDRLSYLAEQNPPDAFSLRRVEGEIRQLLKNDAANAYMLWGIFSSITGDVEGIRSNHEKSLLLRDDSLMRENYGNSLGHVGLWVESLEQFEASIRYLQSPRLLRSMIGYAVQAGCPGKAMAYYQQLVKIEPSVKDDPDVARMLTTISLLAEAGMSDEEISSINRIATQVAMDFDATFDMAEIWVNDQDSEAKTVVCWLRVHHQDVASLNWELAGRYADADTEALRSHRYMVSFIEATR